MRKLIQNIASLWQSLRTKKVNPQKAFIEKLCQSVSARDEWKITNQWGRLLVDGWTITHQLSENQLSFSYGYKFGTWTAHAPWATRAEKEQLIEAFKVFIAPHQEAEEKDRQERKVEARNSFSNAF